MEEVKLGPHDHMMALECSAVMSALHMEGPEIKSQWNWNLNPPHLSRFG